MLYGTTFVVFLSIAPGSRHKVLMQKQIPHELAHVLLYRYVGENYNRLPLWLLEGSSSIADNFGQLALVHSVVAKNEPNVSTVRTIYVADQDGFVFNLK